MQRLEVIGAVRPIYGSLGVKGLNPFCHMLALLGAHHILHVSGIRVTCSYPSSPGFCLFVSCFRRQFIRSM